MAVNLARDRADLNCAQVTIEWFSVRVCLDCQAAGSARCCALCRVGEQSPANPLTDSFRQNPEVFQAQHLRRFEQGAKRDHLPGDDSGKGFIRRDELGRDRELFAPSFHPM